MVPSLFGTRDRFPGRQFCYRLQWGGMEIKCTLHWSCTLFLLLLYQLHLRSSGIRAWRLGTTGLEHRFPESFLLLFGGPPLPPGSRGNCCFGFFIILCPQWVHWSCPLFGIWGLVWTLPFTSGNVADSLRKLWRKLLWTQVLLLLAWTALLCDADGATPARHTHCCLRASSHLHFAPSSVCNGKLLWIVCFWNDLDFFLFYDNFNSTWTKNFQMFKLDLEKAEE